MILYLAATMLREIDATLGILKSTVEDSDLFHEVVVNPFEEKS